MLDTLSGSSPRRIRQKNVMAALRCIHSFGAMSRAELARQLGLNRSSSGQIVGELTASGFVREIELSESNGDVVRAGRPGIKLELIPEAAFFFGIEIGVEHISSVLVDLSGRMREHRKKVFDTPAVPVQEALAEAMKLALGGHDAAALARCQGLGISSPAHIRSDGYVTVGAILGWRDVPLADYARECFPLDVPIIVENDANAFAIGDLYKTGSAGVTLFLVMETGVGGGILIDGKLFRGGHGLAGEIGHTPMPGNNSLKLEQLIGRDSLVLRYRKAQADQSLDLQDFIAAVRDRVPAAVDIAEDWARHLAHALVLACRLLDPQRVVLGGSLAPLFTLVQARVRAHMSAGQDIAFPSVDIIVDEDAEFGSAYGAACLMHQQFLAGEGGLPTLEEIDRETTAKNKGR